MWELTLDNHIAFMRLNRPEAYNALNLKLLEELALLCEQLESNDNIRAIVFTSAGDKAFCAGADLKERLKLTPAEVQHYVSTISSTFRKVERLPQPTIAALNGVAFGGGLELALACDLRLAHEDVKLGLTEVSLGIIPGAGGTQRLSRIVGLAKAKELIFTACRFDALEAMRIGLINKVVPRASLIDEAISISKTIAQNAPRAVRNAKYAIDRGYDLEIDAGLLLEQSKYYKLIPTQDRLEGLAAFQEKRTPSYLGR